MSVGAHRAGPVAGRPAYHVTAPRNWLSDPNGPIYWQGRYHVFYQHNPDTASWGLMHWGHVSSADLVHWTDHGIALAPSVDGPDRDGCWSGCARIVDGRPTIFYTAAAGHEAAHAETVCLAVSDGDLTRWIKDPANPVVPSVPAGLGLLQYRDPFVLRDGDRWLMLLGTGRTDSGAAGAGAVVAFESTDLHDWRYCGIVLSRPGGLGPIDTGPVWECPQLLRLGDVWVLIVSVQMPGRPDPLCKYAVWFIGDFVGTTFRPATMGLVDYGNVFYAPAVLDGPFGEPLVWGWLQELAPAAVRDRQGFAGALSLPRSLSLSGDALISTPAVELDRLWGGALARSGRVALDSGSSEVLVGVPGVSAYRVTCSVETSDAEAGVRLPAGGAGATVVAVDARSGRKRLVVREAGQDESSYSQDVPLAAGSDSVTLRVFVDGPIVEVFVEDGPALTTRLTPGPVDRAIELSAVGGAARFSDVDLRALGQHGS
jgi:beta-fructofuranosidase